MDGNKKCRRLCGSEQFAGVGGLCVLCFLGADYRDGSKSVTRTVSDARRLAGSTAKAPRAKGDSAIASRSRGGESSGGASSSVSTSTTATISTSIAGNSGGASSSASSSKSTTINAANTSGGGWSASSSAASTTASRRSSTISTATNTGKTSCGGSTSSSSTTAGDTGSDSGGSETTSTTTSSSSASSSSTTINAANTSGGGSSASMSASSTTASRRRSSSTSSAANAGKTSGGGSSSSTTVGDIGSGSGGSSASSTTSSTSTSATTASSDSDTASRGRSRTSAKGASGRKRAHSRSASQGGSADLLRDKLRPICKTPGCAARAVPSTATSGLAVTCTTHSLYTPTGRTKGVRVTPPKSKACTIKAYGKLVGRRFASVEEDGSGRVGWVVDLTAVKGKDYWVPNFTLRFGSNTEEIQGADILLAWIRIFEAIELAFADRGTLASVRIGAVDKKDETGDGESEWRKVEIPFSKRMRNGRWVVSLSRKNVKVEVLATFGHAGVSNGGTQDA